MVEIKRLCLGCNKLFNVKDLIKIKIFEKKIIINPKYYISGRGAYLCYNMECINKAKKSKRLEKSFKGNLKVTEEVWQLLNVVLEAMSERSGISKGISFYGK